MLNSLTSFIRNKMDSKNRTVRVAKLPRKDISVWEGGGGRPIYRYFIGNQGDQGGVCDYSGTV